MKLLTTLFLAAFFTSSSFAQTNSPTWNTFLSDLQKAQVEYNAHYSEKKYQQAANVLSTVATTLDNLKLTEKEKQEFQPTIKDVYANVYYNLACLQSLLNEKNKPLPVLKKQ